ncbi:hypothetical protein P4S72_12130 [Vibrio sp. PP-XX7]
MKLYLKGASAAGIRRIEAVTGEAALDRLDDQESACPVETFDAAAL